ncbi:hypothetical protein ABZT02_06040 [Streptomyces sp. NPDC005402]|uniref:hypothetical protein n=1 Tax=Streptomyces sp. NPDC005402 TaxID=3155338 RepID=UPI0033B9B648
MRLSSTLSQQDGWTFDNGAQPKTAMGLESALVSRHPDVLLSKGLSMSYFLNNVWGDSIDEPDEARIREVLAELKNSDSEHFDIALVHDSGWSLSVYPDKAVVWENVINDVTLPCEFTFDSWQDVLKALLNLSRGEVSATFQMLRYRS